MYKRKTLADETPQKRVRRERPDKNKNKKIKETVSENVHSFIALAGF